ncbi:hypothetical protein BAE44_0000136 [Dichanthelium oligosanthes]|uniref:Uncharacterized protein n=1 Tax=Dichanthelium oligosanthes TaxID=888268 RepID=A0A1E5WN86_9POAL|nr:hypothetical protein BAE44_0000136 [Dichanthelium oligosanthes]
MSASVGPGKDGCGSDGAARVYPMLGLLEAGDLGADKNKPDESRGAGAGAGASKSSGARLRRHRPWQPVLDTIEEVP